MNARQRRLVRRAVDRYNAAELAYMYGDPNAPEPRITRAVLNLLRRTRRKPYHWSTRRHPLSYGRRCSCGRSAHTAEGLCRACDVCPF